MTCDDYDIELGVITKGHASPEMAERCREHRALCVTHGGVMPSHEDLQQIFRDMFIRVGHAEICKGNGCKCGDDPPTFFESAVVRQFKNTEKKA